MLHICHLSDGAEGSEPGSLSIVARSTFGLGSRTGKPERNRLMADRTDLWSRLEDEIRAGITSLGVPPGHTLKVTLKAEVELIELSEDGQDG